MKKQRKPHPNQTSEEIAAVIARYRASGLGLQQFARENSIPAGRLHYWVYQRRPEGISQRSGKRSPLAKQPVFREVKLTTAQPLATYWAAEVDLPRGFTVRFSGTAAAEWIGWVLQALQGPC